jgi:Dolichyl-phosphate-mannose-protein mannosyltransferase
MPARIAITTIVGLYLVLAATYSFVTPLGEGPDEPGHAKYVFFLAREWRLPVQCAPPCESEVPGEGHQPPLAYLLATPALLWLAPAERTFDLPGNRNFVWAGGNQVHAVGHGSREYWPWQGEVLAWHLARLINVVVGAGTVIVTYLIGRNRFNTGIGLLASALVALNPQYLFTAGLITNDILLVVWCAIIMWVMAGKHEEQTAVFTEQMANRYRLLAIGILLGLALITKQSALVLVPFIGVWCLVQAFQWQGAAVAQNSSNRFIVAVARGGSPLALIFGVALLLSAWWYLRNVQLYGDPLGLAIFKAEFMTQAFEAGDPAAWWSALITLHESFWARFGWMNVRPPTWVIWCYTMLVLLAIVGIGLRMRTVQLQQIRLLDNRIWLMIALPVITGVWLISFALTAGLVAWQGRLLFPALPALALLMAYGLHQCFVIVAKQQIKPIAIGGVVLFAGLAAWLPFGVIKPSYPFYTIPAAVAESRMTNPIYARFARRPDERGAALRNIAIIGDANAAQTLQIQLLWNALGRQNRDWWVYIHLVDAQETILAEDNRQPTNGVFPMLQWVAGDWIESTHSLTLPADLQPGSYQLRIGLWYPNNNRRAGYFDQEGTLQGDFYEMDLTVK